MITPWPPSEVTQLMHSLVGEIRKTVAERDAALARLSALEAKVGEAVADHLARPGNCYDCECLNAAATGGTCRTLAILTRDEGGEG